MQKNYQMLTLYICRHHLAMSIQPEKENAAPAEESSDKEEKAKKANNKEETPTNKAKAATDKEESPNDKKEPTDKAKKRFPVYGPIYTSPPWAVTSVTTYGGMDYDTQFDHWTRRDR